MSTKENKKILYAIPAIVFALFLLCACIVINKNNEDAGDEYMKSLYGENQVLESYSGDLGVKCNNGTFVGLQDGDVVSYKGIPYAVQPVGDLRWKTASAAADDDGIYEAYYFGKSCIQPEDKEQRAYYYEQGEDCLTLNVWTNAANSSTNKPVIVFIHGGGFDRGGTADPMYDGHNIVEKNDDIVFVSINYRLGLLGFLDLSSVEGGEEYPESGNLGLLDQIEALKWVQKNISAFGGDPGNVTLYGDKTGAGCASLLMAMPQAKGLFGRVVAESCRGDYFFTKEECKKLTERLVDAVGAECVDDLLALPGETLAALSDYLTDNINFPELDGVVLPESIEDLYAADTWRDVDLLIGTNSNEWNYWADELKHFVEVIRIPVKYDNIRMKTKDEADKEVLKDYLALVPGSRNKKYSELLCDVFFRLPSVKIAEDHASLGGNTYMYYWQYPSAVGIIGSGHPLELCALTGNYDQVKYAGAKIDRGLVDKVQQMLVNFARSGCPDTDEVSWQQFNAASRSTMIFDSDCHMEDDPKSQKRVMLSPLVDKYLYSFHGENTTTYVRAYYMYGLIIILLVGAIAGLTYLFSGRSRYMVIRSNLLWVIAATLVGLVLFSAVLDMPWGHALYAAKDIISDDLNFILEYYGSTICTILALFLMTWLIKPDRFIWKSFLFPKKHTEAAADESDKLADLYGRSRNSFKMLGLGLLIGVVTNGFAILCAVIHGDITFSLKSLSGQISLLLIALVCVFVQSSSEELWCRGYMYERLHERYPLWVAIAANGALFGLLHSFNRGATIMPILSIAVCGISYSLLRWYTGSIWVTMGAHTAWNYTQAFIFGLPNSGLVSEVSIFRLNEFAAGSNVIYDYTFGVEGALPGIFSDLMLAVVIIILAIKSGRIKELGFDRAASIKENVKTL